jgi:O-antigen/teichoic acid export membrane protein
LVKLGRSLSWVSLSQFSTVVLQFASSIVLARILTPVDMGIFAVATATVGVISILQSFGLQSLIVREKSLTDDVAATAFTINALIAVFIAASVVALSYAGGQWLHDGGVRNVVLALALNPLLGALAFLPAARLERAGDFKPLAFAGIASGVGSAGTSIVAAIFGARYMSAAYAGWASAIAYAVVLNAYGWNYVRVRPAFSQWRRVAKYGLQMLTIGGLSQIGFRLTDLCLGKFQGLAGLGMYSRSASLNAMVWNNIHSVASKVMLVEFANLNRNGISLRERYIATVDVMTALLWPTFVGFGIVSGPLIQLVYGPKWVAAAPVFATVSFASVISVSSTMSWEIFSVTSNLALQSRLEVYNVIFSTVTFAVASSYSLVAAAGSRVVSSAFAAMNYRRHLNRITDTVTMDFLPIYFRNALLTGATVSPVLYVMLSHKMSANTPLIQVIAATLAGIIIWIAGLFLLKHTLMQQTLTFIRSKRRLRLPGDAESQATEVAALRPYEIADSRLDGATPWE